MVEVNQSAQRAVVTVGSCLTQKLLQRLSVTRHGRCAEVAGDSQCRSFGGCVLAISPCGCHLACAVCGDTCPVRIRVGVGDHEIGKVQHQVFARDHAEPGRCQGDIESGGHDHFSRDSRIPRGGPLAELLSKRARYGMAQESPVPRMMRRGKNTRIMQ